MRGKTTEVAVGLFMIFAVIGFLSLALKVSGLSMTDSNKNTYKITAEFDNIGGLKIRAPVTVAGVRIGQVSKIRLDSASYKAVVTLKLNKVDNHIPND